MLYDCDSWLAWPFCWIYFGQIVTVLQGLSLIAFGWALWQWRDCWGGRP